MQIWKMKEWRERTVQRERRQKDRDVRSEELPLRTGEGVGKGCDVLFSGMGTEFQPPFYLYSSFSSSR